MGHPVSALDQEKQERDEDAGEEGSGDEGFAAGVLPGHDQAGGGGEDQAEGGDGEEDFDREWVVRGAGRRGLCGLWRFGFGGFRGLCSGERGLLALGDVEGSLFVELGEVDEERGWDVGASAAGLVQAEHLQTAGDGEEEDRGGEEDAGVEMGEADGFERACGWHGVQVV
jgi:hypothetical protein